MHSFVYKERTHATAGHALDVAGPAQPGIGGLVADRMNLPKDKAYMGFPLSVIDLMQA
jgi:hypothetical protein